MDDDRQYAPATPRNRDFILDVLRDVLPRTGMVLEIASGSGEHIAHFARNFPALVFQRSDPEPEALLSIAAWMKARGVMNARAPIALAGVTFASANGQRAALKSEGRTNPKACSYCRAGGLPNVIEATARFIRLAGQAAAR